jgi:hypothetical protein
LEVRKIPGEVHRVLARPRADFERAAGLREPLAQYLEDRLAIALASRGMRLHGARRKVCR